MSKKSRNAKTNVVGAGHDARSKARVDASPQGNVARAEKNIGYGHNHSLLYLLCVTIATTFLICLLIGLRLINHRTTTPSKKYNLTIQQQKKLLNETDPNRIATIYGHTQTVTMKEVQSFNSAKWDRSMIDKAYFCLIYADKVGDYSQAGMILLMLGFVQKNGINIDDNSFGIGKRQLDVMQARVDTYQKQTQPTQGGPR